MHCVRLIYMRIPTLTSLKAFEAAARHESFSRAGDELHVTHAAVSHQMRLLEEWFGFVLFERAGRGVRLTRSGRALSANLTRAFEDIEESCLKLRSSGRRTLTIGCIPSIASRWLVPRITHFTTENPDLETQVLYADARQGLSDADFDVLITLGKDHSPNTTAIKLFSAVSKPVCSPHYLSSRGPVALPEGIGQASLIHDGSRDGWKQWQRRAGHRLARELAGPVFQDFNLLATAVIAGHGIALCPVDVFREELARGDLVVLSDIGIKTDTNYFVIAATDPSAAARRFIDWFVHAINQG